MFRNKEFKRFTLIFCVLCAASITCGFIISPPAGMLALCSAVVFGTSFFLFTKARYKRLAQMSNQIDLVLHNADRLMEGDVEEGEISILHSEITKMTLRIREQNDALKKDRQYLADSLTDIAHQLRTPLTSANLILSFLAKNPAADDHLTYVRELEGLLMRMDWLITSLLKISRVDAGVVVFQNEEVSLRNSFQSALRNIAIPLELRNITISLDIPEDILIVGDQNWLEEAFQNILKNCMESVGENGEIAITCNDNTLYTQVTIHDNGSGFSKDDLPYMFDRFYRGKNSSAAGFGIGLALSKMIFAQQGGLITAKNHAEGGAVFDIHFSKQNLK